jgi:hypothetical protein
VGECVGVGVGECVGVGVGVSTHICTHVFVFVFFMYIHTWGREHGPRSSTPGQRDSLCKNKILKSQWLVYLLEKNHYGVLFENLYRQLSADPRRGDIYIYIYIYI